MPETEITNSLSALFVSFAAIMALNVMVVFFGSILGQVIGKLFEE